MQEPAECGPRQDQRPGGDTNLPLKRDGLLAANDRQTSLHASHRTALDVDDVREARLEERLASLPASTSGTTDDVQRLIGRPVAGLHQRGRVQSIQGDIACDRDVNLPKLDGGANVDEFDLPAFLAEFCKLGGRNAGSVHDLLRVAAALVIGMSR